MNMFRTEFNEKEFYEVAYEESYEEGFEVGYKEGFKLGLEKYIKQGRKQAKIKIAKNMLAMNKTPEFISEVTDLSLDEIKLLENS